MEIRKIEFAHKVTSLTQSLDVCVEVSSGYTYTVEVSTVEGLLIQMGNEDFMRPHAPKIIVKKLTRELITRAIYAYAEENNGYWIKLCQFGDNIDISILDKLEEEHYKKQKEWMEE